MQESAVISAADASRVWSAGRAGRALASLKLTLGIIAVFAAGLVFTQLSGADSAWPVALPLALFAVNLTAAVAINGVFRREAPLLVFHLALIALVLLVAAGRLIHLRGEAEVTVGAAFEGELVSTDAGPLHGAGLRRVRFVNEGFTIDYSAGMRRNETRNAVRWQDGGAWHRAIIGDQQPLVIDGYRFYTSHNKGYAPVFRWRASDGRIYRGTIHLPAYPAHTSSQAQEWMPPNAAAAVWVMLDLDAPLYDAQGAWSFRMPAEHRIVVRSGDERHELKPGMRTRIAGGELEYEALTTWMGYSVFYDPTLPWLLAASVLAVASLAWHFARKFRAHPWDS